MTALEFSPLLGAIVIDARLWRGLTAELRRKLQSAADRASERLKDARRLNEEAIRVMRKHGLTVHEAPPDARRAWERRARKSHRNLAGKVVSQDLVDELERIRTEFRETHGLRYSAALRPKALSRPRHAARRRGRGAGRVHRRGGGPSRAGSGGAGGQRHRGSGDDRVSESFHPLAWVPRRGGRGARRRPSRLTAGACALGLAGTGSLGRAVRVAALAAIAAVAIAWTRFVTSETQSNELVADWMPVWVSESIMALSAGLMC